MSAAVMSGSLYDFSDIMLKQQQQQMGEQLAHQMAALGHHDLATQLSSSASSSSSWPDSDHDSGKASSRCSSGSTSPLVLSSPSHHDHSPTSPGGSSQVRCQTQLSFTLYMDNLLNTQNNPHRKLERTQSEPSKNPALNVNTSRYKTELCRPFEENGSCKYGDKCQFAHGEHELRGLVRHPKYKTEPCRTFHTVGFCPYGPRCHFIHNAEEARGAPPKASPALRSPPVTPQVPVTVASSQPQSQFFHSPPHSPSPPPGSPDARLPVFNRLSAPNTPIYSPAFRFSELLA